MKKLRPFVSLFFKTACYLFVLFSCIKADAQNSIRGRVQDIHTEAPIAGASVFLSNTSTGTVSKTDGSFAFYIPAGQYELVVSMIGYQTFTKNISAGDSVLQIALQPKAQELETVVVTAFERDGWKKWGSFFLDNFIGTSALSKNCKLLNPEVVRFRLDEQKNEITAIALAPLRIQNKALGYDITYQLEEFRYSFNTKYLLFLGYPFFKEMPGGHARIKSWKAARSKAFEGSLMHFMRSVYLNRIRQNNFEVHRLQKQENRERKRVLQMIRRPQYNRNYQPPDSAAYYDKILSQPEVFELLQTPILTGDSIAYAANSTTAALDFDDYLLVIYTKKTAAKEYLDYNPKAGSAMASQLFLSRGKPVYIQSNGNYFESYDLLSIGYWAWWEKLGTMLPYDYVPVE